MGGIGGIGGSAQNVAQRERHGGMVQLITGNGLSHQGILNLVSRRNTILFSVSQGRLLNARRTA